MRRLVRSVSAAIAGALIGAACLMLAHALRQGVSFDMDLPADRFFSGIHKGERDDLATFVWSSEQALLEIDELDRRASWSCRLRFRSPRPEGQPQPSVEILVDGQRVGNIPGTPDYQDFGFRIPEGRASTTAIGINVNPAFQPSPPDKRTLGIQIDRLSCAPARFAWPPRIVIFETALATAFLTGFAALVGVSLGAALLVAVTVGAGAAGMITTASAVYTDYPWLMLMVALELGVAFAVSVSAANGLRKERLSSSALAVIVISVVALWLKLLGLLHPAKPDIDAVFHAHRLADVLGGRYLFTQPFVGGVEMPYAIGLYLFSGLWTWITADHMALVRGVTAASDVAAGALLYPVILHFWNDRRAAVLGVVAYQLVPLSFALLGNANLTNVFGESMALVAIAAAVTWNLHPRRLPSFIGFVAIVTWAFCSHVSTITTLSAMLGVLAVLIYWRGDGSQRWTAVTIIASVALALGLAWLVYYRFFSEELVGAFSRMFGGADPGTASAATAKGFMSTGQRIGDLLRQASSSVGWPLLILAALGAYDLLKRGTRDKLVLALVAWAIVWVVFSSSTVFANVGDEYVRYAAEFLGRINLATIPLVAVLAAKGAAAPGITRRALCWTLVAWAAVIAWGSLFGWFAR